MQILLADLTWTIRIIIFLISIFALYKSLLHYYKIQSIDYLLIAIVFFGYGYLQLHWALFQPTINKLKLAKDPSFFNLIPQILVVQIFWVLGIWAFLVFLARFINIKKQSRSIQLLYGIFCIEGVLEGFYYVLSPIYMLTSSTFQNYQLSEWYLQIWFSHFVIDLILLVLSVFISHINTSSVTPVLGVDFYIVILDLFIAIIYFRTKPIVKTKQTDVSRYAWILFGIFNGFSWICYMALIILMQYSNVLASQEVYFMISLIQFLGMGLLMIVLSFYPEALLISDYQIMKAQKLYQFVEQIEKPKPTPLQFLDINQSLNDYVTKLPPELLMSIEKGKG